MNFWYDICFLPGGGTKEVGSVSALARTCHRHPDKGDFSGSLTRKRLAGGRATTHWAVTVATAGITGKGRDPGSIPAFSFAAVVVGPPWPDKKQIKNHLTCYNVA